MSYKKIAVAVLASSLLLSACGAKTDSKPAEAPKQNAEAPKQASATAADQVKAYKDIVAEFAKAQDGGKADFEKIDKLYNDQFKKLVQARDTEYKEELDQQISSAIKAAKDGSMKPEVAQQLFDKLSQKVVFLSLRHDFKEAEEKFTDKNEAKEEIEEAKTFYTGVLKPSLEKRDTAYGTQLVTALDTAFGEMAKAVDAGKKLDFSLAKQVADKSLMKNFYLAAGGEKGYGYKIEKAVSEGKDPKADQAEGWAFYQSLYAYLAKPAKEDADFINKKFDLQTSTKEVKGNEINKAFVRAITAVAVGEYKESFENWGQDKGVITALEGALFIQMIESDASKILGEAQTKTLLGQANQLLDAAKSGDKAKGDSIYKEMTPALDKLAKTGK